VLELFLGLVTGLIFGFLLQKGQVSKHTVIVEQLLLRDWTVAKIMGTAVVVGALGVTALVQAGWAQWHLKSAALGPLVVGGTLFGIGMAVLGLCPGTAVAACGEGRKDAWAGTLGMLVGAAGYVWSFPLWAALGKSLPDWGKASLASLTDSSPWLWVGLMAAGYLAGGLYVCLRTRMADDLPRGLAAAGRP